MFYHHADMPVPRPVRAAQWVHARYRFPGPPADFVVVAVDPEYNIQVDSRDWPPDLSGICVRGAVVSSIGINKNDSEGRRRFTMWHEFYHYLVHKDEYSFSCGPWDKQRRERECDVFAANVLMPEEWLVEMTGPLWRAARKLGVSERALTWRMQELRLKLK